MTLQIMGGEHGGRTETEAHERPRWEPFGAEACTCAPLAVEVSGSALGTRFLSRGGKTAEAAVNAESQHPGQQALWQAGGPGGRLG